MSIDLPRSARDLHFTGSAKAYAPERPANALGQERPKAPPPPPPQRSVPPPARTARTHDVYIAEAQPTPYIGARPSERLEAAEKLKLASPSKKLTTMRGPTVSLDFEEEILTQALDRDEINAALFPVAKRENAAAPAPNLPVPHFRSAEAAKKHHAEPTIKVPRQSGGGSLPLGVWLFAALIAGIISYQLAPQAAASLTEAVHALDSR